jgi:hypothetical protein
MITNSLLIFLLFQFFSLQPTDQCQPKDMESTCTVVNMTMTIYRETGTIIYDIKGDFSRGFWDIIRRQMLTETLTSKGIVNIRIHDGISNITNDLSTATVRKREQEIAKDEISSDATFQLSRIVGSLILVLTTIFLVIGMKKKAAHK